jgi:hypothetical protein
MWLSKEAYERMLTQAAQSEFLSKALASAEKRAEDAESALASERGSKDWLMLQLSSRVITKHGQYGLDYEKPLPKGVDEPKSPHPKGWLKEPDETDYAKLEYYKLCYRNAGMPEERAELRWEAEMRGENPPLECEVEQ